MVYGGGQWREQQSRSSYSIIPLRVQTFIHCYVGLGLVLRRQVGSDSRMHLTRFLGLASFITNKFVSVLSCKMTQQSQDRANTGLKRLLAVAGTNDKKNDVIYHPPEHPNQNNGNVVFFGGDVQDFPEAMLTHRDNRRYVKWNLENTAEVLHRKFPDRKVFVVRPLRMHLKTFSCFDNFVRSDDCGSPEHSLCTDGLTHLRALLCNVKSLTDGANHESTVLVGFSKGCVVLNQILYAIAALTQTPQEELEQFLANIEDIYWLDGGHSGGSNTWVTDREVLRKMADTKIRVHIDVTPYQVKCHTRPWNGKEEKTFRETLKHLGVDVKRRLHFEDDLQSLETHFQVLEAF